MTLTLVAAISDSATLFLLFLSLVFTAGIVWRVERELDVSYKLFLAALSVLFVAEALSKIFSETAILSTVAALLKFLFSGFLLAGIWTMRDIVRKLDGEKSDEHTPESV